MGTTKSKPSPPPARKRRKKQPRITDYFAPHSRLRPNSSYMYRSIEMLTSPGQRVPHSARTNRSVHDEYEEIRSKSFEKESIPRWQSKWEIAMRPDPSKEKPQRLRTWLSMPLPSVGDTKSNTEKVVPSSKQKRKETLKKGIKNNKRAISPVSEDEEKENEISERMSVKSTKVDQYKMLHMTDEKSSSLCLQTARRWNLDSRRTSKFLSQDWNLKDLQIQEFVPVMRLNKQNKTVINVIPANEQN